MFFFVAFVSRLDRPKSAGTSELYNSSRRVPFEPNENLPLSPSAEGARVSLTEHGFAY